ncbi:uncharacterized protein A4U43_C03F22230 [Asparagus officinalis]|uniref:Bromo domain-containing protein n=1 Tax=Asparagus officinalis TaxID=4686 RepID=A0A5P1FC25_ASPOF|nr:uncharacterized protein A4U43_C03F22230 [Asparagus officinalis]
MSLGFRRWGTWEELVLGGRTPGTPSPARSGLAPPPPIPSRVSAWFEELRKRRVSELKRELEKSDDSIGSLQSKLESLTSEKETGCNFDHNTSQTESTSPIEDAETIDSSGKEVSRDGSSTGSFTEKTVRGLTHKCQNLASLSVQDNNIKIPPEKFLMEKFGCGCLGIGFGSFKKKRGKRKRKGLNIVKEGSAGDSDLLSSAAFTNRQGSEEGCIQGTSPPSEDCHGAWMREDGDDHLNLARIMDSIMKHEDVSVFRVRLESQKKARYKKMIRKHIDFRKLSSSIGNGSVSSANELYRDLLLLCNNALVFYPKNSTEHKSALILRGLVNKKLRRSFSPHSPTYSCSDDEGAVSEIADKPKKLRTTLEDGGAVSEKDDEPKKLKTTLEENLKVSGETKGNPAKENATVAGKGDGTPHKENAAVAGQGVGTARKETAVVTGKRAGTVTPLKENATVGGNRRKENAVSAGKGAAGILRKEKAAVAGKGIKTLRKENETVAGKGVGTALKGTAVVTGRGAGTVTPLKENATIGGNLRKENAMSAGRGAGTLRRENAAVVAGRHKGSLLKEKGNNNKRSQADVAVESAGNKKRCIGRPANGGQRGGRRPRWATRWQATAGECEQGKEEC